MVKKEFVELYYNENSIGSKEESSKSSNWRTIKNNS